MKKALCVMFAAQMLTGMAFAEPVEEDVARETGRCIANTEFAASLSSASAAIISIEGLIKTDLFNAEEVNRQLKHENDFRVRREAFQRSFDRGLAFESRNSDSNIAELDALREKTYNGAVADLTRRFRVEPTFHFTIDVLAAVGECDRWFDGDEDNQ